MANVPEAVTRLEKAVETHDWAELKPEEAAELLAYIRALSAPQPQPGPGVGAGEVLHAVMKVRDTFRQEEEDATGHESWRAAMQAARVSLNLLLATYRSVTALLDQSQREAEALIRMEERA